MAAAVTVGKQLRLDLGQVIQMMISQAPEGVMIQPKEEWPPVAWMILQCEAEGRERKGLAEQLGIQTEDIDQLVADLIQADDQAASELVWGVGVIALKTAAMQVTQVIGKTWDQIEAMAIEKLAEAIQNVSGKAADPQMLAGIAKIANAATRRNQGEGRPGFGGSHRPGVGSQVDVELQSGDLGSITFRFSPRVAAQMSNPNRVIDLKANVVDGMDLKGMEMLRLKEIRPIAEAMDTEESKKQQLAFEEQQAESKARQEAVAGPKKSRAKLEQEAEEMTRLQGMFGIFAEDKVE